SRIAAAHGGARDERDRTRLRRLLGELPGQAGLSELGIDREPVPGLELERRRPVLGHLLHERPAQGKPLVVARLREHPRAPVDPAFLWKANALALALAP